jgi:hypothetical protein
MKAMKRTCWAALGAGDAVGPYGGSGGGAGIVYEPTERD